MVGVAELEQRGIIYIPRNPAKHSTGFRTAGRSVATLLFAHYLELSACVKFALFFLIDSPLSWILCALCTSQSKMAPAHIITEINTKEGVRHASKSPHDYRRRTSSLSCDVPQRPDILIINVYSGKNVHLNSLKTKSKKFERFFHG